MSDKCDMRENIREFQYRKFENSQREKLEKLVNGQDMCLFQRTGSRKFESFLSGTSDNKVNKGMDKPEAQETKQSVQRCITFFKEGDTSLWRSWAIFF